MLRKLLCALNLHSFSWPYPFDEYSHGEQEKRHCRYCNQTQQRNRVYPGGNYFWDWGDWY